MSKSKDLTNILITLQESSDWPRVSNPRQSPINPRQKVVPTVTLGRSSWAKLASGQRHVAVGTASPSAQRVYADGMKCPSAHTPSAQLPGHDGAPDGRQRLCRGHSPRASPRPVPRAFPSGKPWTRGLA